MINKEKRKFLKRIKKRKFLKRIKKIKKEIKSLTKASSKLECSCDNDSCILHEAQLGVDTAIHKLNMELFLLEIQKEAKKAMGVWD